MLREEDPLKNPAVMRILASLRTGVTLAPSTSSVTSSKFDTLDRDSLIANESDLLPQLICSLIAVHACGHLTDVAIDLAIRLSAPIAVMPCCYSGTAKHVPLGPKRALGVSLAADVDRSYRLNAAGFLVDWSAIPVDITPMNRIIIALPRS